MNTRKKKEEVYNDIQEEKFEKIFDIVNNKKEDNSIIDNSNSNSHGEKTKFFTDIKKEREGNLNFDEKTNEDRILIEMEKLRERYMKYNVSGEFRRCLEKELTFENIEKFSKLKKLAIVFSVSSDRLEREEYKRTSSSMKCYCKIHGFCEYVEQIVPDNQKKNFMRARHIGVLKNIISKYQWVLHVDADTIVFDYSRKFEEYIDWDSDYEGYLIQRMNGATTTQSMMKNYPFGKCFLKLWTDVGIKTPSLNYCDNGDIMTAVGLMFNKDNYQKYCHKERVNSRAMEWRKCLAKRIYPSVPTSQIPIKILRVREGFWRCHEDTERPSDPLYNWCWQDDFLVHGFKKLGQVYVDDSIVKCDDPKLILQKKPKCLYLTDEQELFIAKRRCLLGFPKCFKNGKNVCLEYCIENRKNFLVEKNGHYSSIDFDYKGQSTTRTPSFAKKMLDIYPTHNPDPSDVMYPKVK